MPPSLGDLVSQEK